MDPADLSHRFNYHPPTTDDKVKAHETARSLCRELAEELNDLLPDGREKALAITNLEQTLFWANAAIARQ